MAVKRYSEIPLLGEFFCLEFSLGFRTGVDVILGYGWYVLLLLVSVELLEIVSGSS